MRADTIVTRVGSSSPETAGSAAPLTFGSSLKAKTVPFARRSVDWLVTTVPLERLELSVMSNWIRAWPLAGTFRLRMSMTPVPLAPPVLLVPLMSAPAGVRDERERAGHECRLCVERIQLVKDPEIAERLIGRAEAQGIAQLVARRGRCRGICTARQIRDGLLEDISRERHRHGVGVLMVQRCRACRWSACACKAYGWDCCCRH